MAGARLSHGFKQGLKATLVMSVPMIIGTVSGRSPMPKPFPKAIADELLGEDAPAPLSVAVAIGGHLLYGSANGAALASFGRPVTLKKGLSWGVGLWAVLQTVFMPVVGWGVFGRKVSRMVPVATLVLHLVYGGTLGWLTADDTAITASGDAPTVEPPTGHRAKVR